MSKIEMEIKLDFKDVLIKPKRGCVNSRNDVSLERTFEFLHSKRKWTGVPIIAANMDTVGTFEMAEALASKGVFTAIHKHYDVADWKLFAERSPQSLQHVAASCGIGEADMVKLSEILKECPQVTFICIDVANGYSQAFVDFIKATRAKYTGHTIIAGNVVTREQTVELISQGADIVKVGIGPGSVCTTRKQTGVGYPQLSAILDCADAAHNMGGHVISDGGCTEPGDVAKAFGAAADFVMLGGMFAGHDECKGEVREGSDGKLYKIFYGMSSETAMNKYAGGVANYRSSEGKTVRVECRGPVVPTVNSILGGIRSACTYVGARKLEEFEGKVTFVRCTRTLNDIFSPSEAVTILPEAKRSKT